jgi:hypothetical protein
MNALIYSKQIKVEAEEILESTKLLKILQEHGDVRVGGSFAMDLMYDPDIDLTIACENPAKSAIQFLNTVIQKQLFQKYQYGDFENHPREGRPKDHIIVLILPYKERVWEIEIWFKHGHNKEQIVLEKKIMQLPQEVKEGIIQRKADRELEGLDKHTLSSYEIYQEALSNLIG